MDHGRPNRDQQPSSGKNSGQLLRRSTTVSLFTGLAVVVGFLVDVLIVSRFGLGAETDAFFGGYTIPFTLVTTIAAIQPVVVTVLAGNRHDKSAFGVLLSASGLVTVALAAIGALLARPLVAVTTPGFAPQTAARASFLAQILFARVPAAAIAEVCKAELFTQRRFGLATFSNALPGLVTVVFLLAGARLGIQIAAYGFVAGSLVQALVLVGILLGPLRVPFRWKLRDSMPVLRQTGRLMSAPLAGLVLRQAVTVAERFLGSYLPAGSVTALSYASRLTMIVAGVFFDALNRAALPSMATLWSQGKRVAARSELETLLKMMWSVSFPVGLTVAALSTPLVRLFFQQGQVDYQAALLMGTVLGVYALSLPFLGPYRVVRTFFFAVKEARPVVILHGALAALTVCLDLILVWSLGAVGLALAYAVSSAMVMIISMVWLVRWTERPIVTPAQPAEVRTVQGSTGPGLGLNSRRLLGSVWRLVLISVMVGAAEYLTNDWLEAVTIGWGRWGLLLSLGLSGVVGLVVFLGLGAALRVELVSVLWSMAKRRAEPGK